MSFLPEAFPGSTSATFTINEEGNAISCLDLAYFLYYLRASYAAFLHCSSQNGKEEEIYAAFTKNDIDRLKKILSSASQRHLPNGPANLALESDLYFTQISMNSPLKFKLGRMPGISMLMLAASVSIAGGSADLEQGKFEVKGLASAVELFMEIINKQPKGSPQNESHPPLPDKPKGTKRLK